MPKITELIQGDGTTIAKTIMAGVDATYVERSDVHQSIFKYIDVIPSTSNRMELRNVLLPLARDRIIPNMPWTNINPIFQVYKPALEEYANQSSTFLGSCDLEKLGGKGIAKFWSVCINAVNTSENSKIILPIHVAMVAVSEPGKPDKCEWLRVRSLLQGLHDHTEKKYGDTFNHNADLQLQLIYAVLLEKFRTTNRIHN